jgi:hypothetical protein
MEPSDRPVALGGTIREIHGYGPPGYGEDKKTDAKVTYLVLELPKSINTPCNPERPEWASTDCAATKRLKLFFSSISGNDLELKARKMMGRRVVLTGTLKRADTAGEMTPIYIEVTAIGKSSGGSQAVR